MSDVFYTSYRQPEFLALSSARAHGVRPPFISIAVLLSLLLLGGHEAPAPTATLAHTTVRH